MFTKKVFQNQTIHLSSPEEHLILRFHQLTKFFFKILSLRSTWWARNLKNWWLVRLVGWFGWFGLVGLVGWWLSFWESQFWKIWQGRRPGIGWTNFRRQPTEDKQPWLIVRLPTQKLQLGWGQITQNGFTCPIVIYTYSNYMTIVYTCIPQVHWQLCPQNLDTWITTCKCLSSKMRGCPSDGITSLVELVEYKT